MRIPATILAMTLVGVCGCARGPSVTVDNQTGRTIIGYVQMPRERDFSISPPPSRRQNASLPSGIVRTFDCERGFDVESFPDVYVAYLINPGAWYVTRWDVPPDTEDVQIVVTVAPSREIVMTSETHRLEESKTFATEKEVLEFMGQTR